jgi:hypothetical protein
VLYTLREQNLINQKVFSMFVDQSDDGNDDPASCHAAEETGSGVGRIVWGGSDERFFVPPLLYLKLVKRGHFEVSGQLRTFTGTSI